VSGPLGGAGCSPLGPGSGGGGGAFSVRTEAAATFDFLTGDVDNMVETTNAAGATGTIVAGLTSTVGAVLYLRQGNGGGQASFAAGPGVTIELPVDFVNGTLNEFAVIAAMQLSADLWTLVGQLDS
jgi:hypothetical protein